MKQELEAKPVENNGKPEDDQAIVSRRETVLPSPFFSAVIAIACACIMLIM